MTSNQNTDKDHMGSEQVSAPAELVELLVNIANQP